MIKQVEPQALAELYQGDPRTDGTVPTVAVDPEVETIESYNVAPTSTVPVVLERSGRDGDSPVRTLVGARWGLLPPWAQTPTERAPLINARVETAAELRSFAKSARERRCILPAHGYIEWVRHERCMNAVNQA
ncbi:SOS response-associated peptidase family protein [Longispora sp. K20-0274]|uniref:SOS response-associated peptidase family protein n=1 Tax=Longispora sp. K20-0274 TaxID=3088255 RepID=UPI00399A004B